MSAELDSLLSDYQAGNMLAAAEYCRLIDLLVAEVRRLRATHESARAWSRRWKACCRSFQTLSLYDKATSDRALVDLSVTRKACANLARRVDELVRERQQHEAERDAMRAVVDAAPTLVEECDGWHVLDCPASGTTDSDQRNDPQSECTCGAFEFREDARAALAKLDEVTRGND